MKQHQAIKRGDSRKSPKKIFARNTTRSKSTRKRKKSSCSAPLGAGGLSHEAGLRKFVETYFRVSNLGSPEKLLFNMNLNRWFNFPHTPAQLGWIGFGFICSNVRRPLSPKTRYVLKSFSTHFAPYLVAAKHHIIDYISKHGLSVLERLHQVLSVVNDTVHRIIFPESLFVGLDSETEITQHHRTMHKSKKEFYNRTAPQVLGTCKGKQQHGPFVVSLSGTVCTSCGRVGSRQFIPHTTDTIDAQKLLSVRSKASGRMLPIGSMTTSIRKNDPTRSITRGQFCAFVARPFVVPCFRLTPTDQIEGPMTPEVARIVYRSCTLPLKHRDWLVFLYDFVKDSGIDRLKREDRLPISWTNAIWLYGYIVLITVDAIEKCVANYDDEHEEEERARNVSNNENAHNSVIGVKVEPGNPHRVQTQRSVLSGSTRTPAMDKLLHFEQHGSDPWRSTTEPHVRCLETIYVVRQVQYLRVVGSSYRFYPEKLSPPQFVLDAQGNMFADTQVHALSRVLDKQSSASRKPLVMKFWNDRYRLKINSGRVLARSTSVSDECYLHVAVSKDAGLVLKGLMHGPYMFKANLWFDPRYVAKAKNATHYFVHCVPCFTSRRVVTKLLFCTSKGEDEVVTLGQIGRSMPSCTFNVRNAMVIVRAPSVSVHLVRRQWQCLLEQHTPLPSIQEKDAPEPATT